MEATETRYIKDADGKFVPLGADNKPVPMLRYIVGAQQHYHDGKLYMPGEPIELPITDEPKNWPSVLWEGVDPIAQARVAAARAKADAVAASQSSTAAQAKVAEARSTVADEKARAAQENARLAVQNASTVLAEFNSKPVPAPAPKPVVEDAQTMSQISKQNERRR